MPDQINRWVLEGREYMLLNGKIFYTLREAQVLIEQWRVHYNTIRPHSSLGYRPPAPEIIIPAEELPNHQKLRKLTFKLDQLMRAGQLEFRYFCRRSTA